jgi:ribosome-binding protein aMBF1 (putative translation factor)
METKRTAKKIYKSKALEDFFMNKDSKSYKRTEKNMLLALRIENARKSLGWNRVRLAKEMNVEPSVITKWLSGTHNFTTDTLFDIEDKLGICLVSITEQPSVVTKKYITIVKTSDSVKWDGIPGKGVTKLNSEGNILITASPLESHKHIGLPIFNHSNHEC